MEIEDQKIATYNQVIRPKLKNDANCTTYITLLEIKAYKLKILWSIFTYVILNTKQTYAAHS
jgi:hypothetical protein